MLRSERQAGCADLPFQRPPPPRHQPRFRTLLASNGELARARVADVFAAFAWGLDANRAPKSAAAASQPCAACASRAGRAPGWRRTSSARKRHCPSASCRASGTRARSNRPQRPPAAAWGRQNRVGREVFLPLRSGERIHDPQTSAISALEPVADVAALCERRVAVTAGPAPAPCSGSPATGCAS